MHKQFIKVHQPFVLQSSDALQSASEVATQWVSPSVVHWPFVLQSCDFLHLASAVVV